MSLAFPLKIGSRSYVLRMRLGFTLLCLFFFVVLCRLGVWQMQRYHFKQTLVTTYQQRLSAKAQALTNLSMASLESLQFQKVRVTGEYMTDITMLLQNQFHQEQTGFDVLTPFRIQGEKKLLLVDRGWVQRYEPKNIPMQQTITGYIKLLNESVFILGQNILAPNAKPLVMQKIDIAELSRVTHQDYFPFVLRLDPAMRDGFVREWVISTMPPERHLAYAVQWFVMALVLLIAYVCFSCERIYAK